MIVRYYFFLLFFLLWHMGLLFFLLFFLLWHIMFHYFSYYFQLWQGAQAGIRKTVVTVTGHPAVTVTVTASSGWPGGPGPSSGPASLRLSHLSEQPPWRGRRRYRHIITACGSTQAVTAWFNLTVVTVRVRGITALCPSLPTLGRLPLAGCWPVLQWQARRAGLADLTRIPGGLDPYSGYPATASARMRTWPFLKQRFKFQFL